MKQTSDFIKMKANGEKIAMITAYDYPSAKLSEEGGADIILVGDSLGMVVLGYESTVPVTLDDMIHHTKAVKRGRKKHLSLLTCLLCRIRLAEKKRCGQQERLCRKQERML